MLSIFGNVHYTLKALPNIIITNSGHHPLFFSCAISPILLLFFISKIPISIFRSAHWTLGTVPNVVTNSEHHHQAHQCALQPCPIYESDHNRCTKMTSFLLELGPLTPLQTREIYSEAMPAQKYISKVWQWHLRVHPPKIYPYCISLTKYILQVWHRHYNFCVTFQGPCVKNIF